MCKYDEYNQVHYFFPVAFFLLYLKEPKLIIKGSHLTFSCDFYNITLCVITLTVC